MKKKDLIGSLVLAAVILISLPLGVKRSVGRLRDEAENTYYYDATGYALYTGVEARAAAAKNLLTVAQRYSDPAVAKAADRLDYWVRLQANAYDDYRDHLVEAETNDGITAAARDLVEALGQVELAPRDAAYREELWAQLQSEQDKLERSSYNDDARAFNARLEKAPLAQIKGLLGIRPLGVFDAADTQAPATAVAQAPVLQ